MPNRVIKESICTSENIDQLTAFQETFFFRLIVNCDDFGRMDARPKILASRLYPLKDVRNAQIEDALRALSSAELVILYEIDGKPFLQMKTWDRHQIIRAKKSRYPGPRENLHANECNCMQMHANVSVIQSNTIQSENESESESEYNCMDAFDRFWKLYPRKAAKQDAIKAWKKLNPGPELVDVICAAVTQSRKTVQWKREGGQFVPYPATYLNGRRWEDEPQKADHGYIETAYNDDELLAAAVDLDG